MSLWNMGKERSGYLKHLLDLLPRQIYVEFVKKLQNLTDA